MKKGQENMGEKVFYKTNPRRGISLIVLVITIIIIIILAAAVIVNIINNNPMSEAREARIKSDVANMQAIFTNTIGKIMSEKQDIIEIEAGKLNTVTSGEKSAVGNAVYKFLDDTTGQIIFDTLDNKENEYYTEKRLPIYNKETKWYVDEDGIISLEVGSKRYGNGRIVKNIKIRTEVIPSEEYIKKNAKVKIEICFEEEVESIKFGGRDIAVPTKKDGKYETEVEVTENGIYEIEVNGTDGAKNTASVEVNQIDEIDKNMKIKAQVLDSGEYIKNKVTVQVEIDYNEEIEEIRFDGNNVVVPEKKNGKYTLQIEVTKNGTYKIEVRGKNGVKNSASVEVNQIDVLNSQIQIKPTVTVSSDYVKADIGLEITYSGVVESIKVNGESLTIPSKKSGKYTVSKEVLENGEYKVEVKSKDGTINKTVVKVTDITEDMDIWNKADMISFRNKVNSGRTFEGRKATVRANIDLQGSESNKWSPVGYYIDDTNYKTFKGTFEGGNFLISNLYIDSTSICQGLFGHATNATIRNVRVGGNIKGGNFTGGIIGCMSGTITNCKNSVTVTGTGDYIGGIAGYLDGTIGSSTNSYGVYGVNSVGGIVGHHKGIMMGCTNTAGITGTGNSIGGVIGYKEASSTVSCINNLSVTGNNNVGGIVGTNNGTITGCKNNSGFLSMVNTIYGKWNCTGGIAGVTTGNIYNSSNFAIVQGTNQLAGGIAGKSIGSATISSCFNIGAIKINTWNVGGITGWNEGPIYYCYNRGSVNCSSYYTPYDGSWAGGISGTANNNIHYCYNTGSVYGYSRCVSGIAGGAGDMSMTIVNAYNAGSYSQTRSGYIGQITGQKKGGCTVQNSWQVSENDLKTWDANTITTYLTTNFVKDTNNINEGYPILEWQL